MNQNPPCDVHSQQIKSIEKRMEKVEQRTEDMVDMKVTLARLTTIMEQVEIRNKERDDLNRKQNETLDRINENLNNLNKEMKQSTQRIDSLETQVSEVKDNSTININSIVKQGIMGGTIAAIGYYIGKFLGTK